MELAGLFSNLGLAADYHSPFGGHSPAPGSVHVYSVRPLGSRATVKEFPVREGAVISYELLSASILLANVAVRQPHGGSGPNVEVSGEQFAPGT